MPRSKSTNKGLTVPFARVDKIMRKNITQERLSSKSVWAVTVFTDLFFQAVVESAADLAVAKDRKTIKYKDIVKVIEEMDPRDRRWLNEESIFAKSGKVNLGK